MRRAVIFGRGHFRSLRISDYQNIPLSYKIRLNRVRPANKIHPYNQLSEYFLYFCRYIALIWELSMAYAQDGTQGGSMLLAAIAVIGK